MSRPASPSLVRGACPGVVAPMEAADGMLLRVRLPGGAIDADGLRTVADVAERYGSGVVELTVRANLQIRGVDPADAAEAGDRLVAAGLALADPVRDERRDIIGPPLAGHDPTELLDLSGVVAEVADRLAVEPDLDGLPPKFGVVLDGGGAASLRSVPADVVLVAVRAADGRIVLRLTLGGTDGPSTGIAVTEVVPVVLAAAHLAASHGERVASLVDRLGPDAIVDAVTAATATHVRAPVDGSPAVVDRSGAAPFPGRTGPAARRSTADPAPVPAVAALPAPIGPLPHRHADRVNIGTAPFLGRTGPAGLRSVADLAEVTGASVRLTPWRGLVLVDVPRSRLGMVTGALAAAGFSADPDDPAHLVSACVGLPGCASSRADTQAAGRALLRRGGPTDRIHLSGCDKRCGAGTGPVVVAAEDGTFEVGPW